MSRRYARLREVSPVGPGGRLVVESAGFEASAQDAGAPAVAGGPGGDGRLVAGRAGGGAGGGVVLAGLAAGAAARVAAGRVPRSASCGRGPASLTPAASALPPAAGAHRRAPRRPARARRPHRCCRPPRHAVPAARGGFTA